MQYIFTSMATRMNRAVTVNPKRNFSLGLTIGPAGLFPIATP